MTNRILSRRSNPSRVQRRLPGRNEHRIAKRIRRLTVEQLESRQLLATFNHVFTDINPDQSDLDASDPDGASGGRVGGMSVVAGDNQTFYAASEFGGIFKSTDGGLEWEHLEGHLPMVTWDVEVDPSNPNKVYATSFFDGRLNSISGIQVSSDAGATWIHPLTAHANPALEGTPFDNTPQAGYNAANSRRTEPSAFGIGIRPDNTNIVFIGTNAGVARTTDGGLTWQIIDPTPLTPANANVWDVVVQAGGPMGQGIVDIVGDDGHLRSVDGGNIWTNANSLPAGARGRASISVSPDESYVLLVAGANGSLFESDDAGVTWTNLGRTDPIRGGNRIPFVVSNQKSNVNVDGDAALENVFDIWTGGVSLYRVQCVTPDAPAIGGAARCPTGANPLPAGWFGGFTRGGLGAGTGAHDDVGDVLFDSEVAVDAPPVMYSGDGGIYYAQTTSASPTGIANLVFEQPDVTPHALWIYGMAGFDVAGGASENLYIGMQDAGDFATTNLGAGTPTWHQEDCCDIFDYATDGTTVVYQRGFTPPPGRGFNLILADPTQTATSVVNTYPADGLLSQFKFGESIETFGANSFIVLMQDCSNPATNTIDDDGDGMVDEADELSDGCPMVNGGDGGAYITTDITAAPIVWTELGNATEPNSAALVDVQVSIAGGVPTFYVLVGGGNGRTADQLWSFTGTNPAGAWTRIDTNIPGGGGVNVFAADPNNPLWLYASRVNPPGIFSSTDGGATWNPDANLLFNLTGGGAFPFQNQIGPTEFTNLNGYPQPTLLAFNPENPNQIVAGGADSGIHLSTDGGASWRLLSDPFGTDGPDIPHLPRPRFAYFDGEFNASLGEIYIGTQGRGVWRIAPNFDLDPDRFEPNETIATSTILGSPPKIIERDLTIHNASDVDFFQYTAQDTGKLIVNIFFNTLQGDLDLRVRDRFNNIIATGTQSNVTPGRDRERLIIPVVTQEEYYIEVLSSVGHTNEYALEIENFQVRTPITVDLTALSDTGRHDSDNITRDFTPTFDVFLNDADLVAQGFIRDDDIDIQVFNNGLFLGEATFVAGQRWTFTAAPGSLVEGHDNFITAAVLIRDRAIPNASGLGEHSLPLQVTLDTIAPSISILGIDPSSSDTGAPGQPATFSDRVTSDIATGFIGQAEADAVVRLFVDGTANGVVNIPGQFGLTVALPFDGDEAFPSGQWRTSFVRNLNDPALFAHDGVREVIATAEDLAGNVSTPLGDDILLIFIDTQGPQITDVDINTAGNAYDLFDPKPSTDGPTPLVNSLVISVRDLPNRSNADPNFLYNALAAAAAVPGNYVLTGDASGVIPIASIVVTPDAPVDGSPATATIQLNFFSPLPDDRFTLTIKDNLVDPAGNKLDGESNAAEPQELPLFPSGDGIPGGAFVARFTVDSRAELGVYSSGSIYVDTNGNFTFDPTNADFTNRDITYLMGFTSDNSFAGNFAGDGPDNVFNTADDRAAAAGDGVADGFHKLAAYGKVGTAFRWLIDTDNDGVVNFSISQPLFAGVTNVNGMPAAGNFDGFAANGDETVLKVGNVWLLDTNHDFRVDLKLPGTNMIGLPIVGDFDGDGIDDLGAWADNKFRLNLSTLGAIDGTTDVMFTFGFASTRERPAAADFDGDGIDDLGLWVPDRSGAAPHESAEWYLLISGGQSIVARLAAGGGVINFEPTPFGNDRFAQFGDEFGLPVVGNFDPPLTSAADSGGNTNLQNPLDVNNDGAISPLDALLVLNLLSSDGPTQLTQPSFSGAPFRDVNQDGYVSPLDALLVLNWLNSNPPAASATPTELGDDAGEGESAAADAYFAQLAAMDDLDAHTGVRRNRRIR